MSSLVVKIAAEKNLVTILEKICEGYQFSFHGISDEMRIEEFHLKKPDIIFASSEIIEKVYDSLNGDNYRPSLFVTTNESDLELPGAFIHGKADDLFTLPPRKSEFLSKVKLHHHLQQLKEIEISTKAVPELVKKLQEDLALAEKVQRRLIKDKFDPIHGVTIKSKYWCGLKSGGDYFDVFDFGDGAHIGFLLTDCSSYSLSTAFLSSLMQLSLGMKNTDVEHPKVIVEKIFDQIKGSMKPKDKLSICFGVLNRKDFKFKFVTYGNVFLARKQPESSIDWLYNGIENPPITVEAGLKGLPREVVLEPEERILFFSDGWQECLSGAEFNELVHRLGAEEKDSQNFINEMAFRLRRGLEKASDEPVTAESDFPMPMQDCSVLLVDMPRNVIRLTAVK